MSQTKWKNGRGSQDRRRSQLLVKCVCVGVCVCSEAIRFLNCQRHLKECKHSFFFFPLKIPRFGVDCMRGMLSPFEVWCIQMPSRAQSGSIDIPRSKCSFSHKSSIVFKTAIFLTLDVILFCRFCGYIAINLCPLLELDLEQSVRKLL